MTEQRVTDTCSRPLTAMLVSCLGTPAWASQTHLPPSPGLLGLQPHTPVCSPRRPCVLTPRGRRGRELALPRDLPLLVPTRPWTRCQSWEGAGSTEGPWGHPEEGTLWPRPRLSQGNRAEARDGGGRGQAVGGGCRREGVCGAGVRTGLPAAPRPRLVLTSALALGRAQPDPSTRGVGMFGPHGGAL